MEIPTKGDWGTLDPRDLDAHYALNQFLGKSHAEAEALFAANSWHYSEDLYYMPEIPFNFYATAFASYLRSNEAREDSLGASIFMDLLASSLKKHPKMHSQVRDELVSTARDIAARQSFYGADEKTYGSFPDLMREIEGMNGAHSA